MCGCIFRMDSNADGPGVRFVHEHPEILDILFQGCERAFRNLCRENVLPGQGFDPYVAGNGLIYLCWNEKTETLFSEQCFISSYLEHRGTISEHMSWLG